MGRGRNTNKKNAFWIAHQNKFAHYFDNGYQIIKPNL